MAKHNVVVTRADGKVFNFEAGSRREAERDEAAMKKNFPGRIRATEIKEKH
jgi:hypothetical protein